MTFLDAMHAVGIVPSLSTPFIADGRLHRFHAEDDKRGTRNGWYVLYTSGIPAGAFGHWAKGITQTWCARDRSLLSPLERTQLRHAILQSKHQRDNEIQRQQHAAQVRAQRLWARVTVPNQHHPYLRQKAIQAHGIRQYKKWLLIPLRDVSSELWAVQLIAPDATKRFLRGSRKHGLYHAIGGPVRDTLCIAEGYATAASIYEATHYPTACAFDAGNLEPVARALRKKYNNVHIVICADNDSETEKRIGRNPGQEKAHAAALAIDGAIALPDFGATE